jgi:hypothetical protein
MGESLAVTSEEVYILLSQPFGVPRVRQNSRRTGRSGGSKTSIFKLLPQIRFDSDLWMFLD